MMRPRYFLCITLLLLCHAMAYTQALTTQLPRVDAAGPVVASPVVASPVAANPDQTRPDEANPNDPSQELLPPARPEPAPVVGQPVTWEAARQTRVQNLWTLEGDVVLSYRDYVVHADRATYDQTTDEVEADGHVRVEGGPDDVVFTATNGTLRASSHTARFYNVQGTVGVHRNGRILVYTTPNPLVIQGRVLLQLGQGNYKIIDGSMTSCRLPKPDWKLIARAIAIENGQASARNTVFQLFHIPILYLPYLRHSVDETGRESGLLIPVLSNSSVKGLVVGEQVYWAINRSMDMVLGTEFYSKRGWAPNGDFRYRGPGLDHLTVRSNALLDRGIEQETDAAQSQTIPRTPQLVPIPVQETRINQGGVDTVAIGRKDLSPETRVAGTVEYLSSYIYRLVFNDNFSQAISSEVQSDLSLTHARNGIVPSIELERFQSFASSTEGDEVRLLRLPSLRFDTLDRPLAGAPAYWGLGTSLTHLGRAEPGLHARNEGRLDIYPHVALPLSGGGWNVMAEAAARETLYSGSQRPDLTGANGGTPTVRHEQLNRSDLEASVDIRPPALERDFALPGWGRELRHVIEPELTYRYVTGIGAQARNVLLFDTTDIATDTSEAAYSLTQRFYLKPLPGPLRSGDAAGEQPGRPAEADQPCSSQPSAANDSLPDDDADENRARQQDHGLDQPACPQRPREWASWQLAQKFFLNANFGGAVIPNRRNVFISTLDLSGISFLTSARNVSPILSRLRFEAIDNLRVEWDLDYDPRAGRFGADNLFAGYSFGHTTVGVGHALLNAVDESGSVASLTKSQQVQPFVTIGKPTGAGFSVAANAGYDFVQGALQYAGVQAAYNWNCCGLSMGYRRFELGSVRDETQYLYSFTIASFGSVGDIRRSNTIFRDPNLPPLY